MKLVHVALIALFTAACGQAAPPNVPTAPAGAPAAKGPLKAPGDAQVGDRTTCPVSGEEFVVTAESPKVQHEGKTYFMCCSGCDKKFVAEPAKYLKKS